MAKPKSPKDKTTLELKFSFSANPFSEEALCTSAIITQLNQFKKKLLQLDWEGWEPVSIESVCNIDYRPAELPPEQLQELYRISGLEHRLPKHPYHSIEANSEQQAIDALRKLHDDEDDDTA